MKKLGFLTIISLLSVLPATAQTFGEVTGTVTDTSGAVVVGADVTVTNTATNQARPVQTNESGNYTVPFLIPGAYDITAEQEGFKLASRAGVEIQVGDVARVDFTMEVGVVTYKQWDFSLLKNTAIAEGHTLQFRFEAFNFPNHPNWNRPGTAVRNARTFGVVTSARTMRELQFGLKYIF